MRIKSSDTLREKMEEEIHSGALQPGDRIDERSLADKFDVSRTPAREAILQLAAAGLVKLVPRQGAVVAGISPQHAIGMIETLNALEGEAAGLAARRISAAQRQTLMTMHREAEAYVKTLDSAAYIAMNTRFHEVIYEAARNEFLRNQIRFTRQRVRFYDRSSLNQSVRLIASWREHGAVLDAFEAGDEKLAQEKMREHISYGGRVFADLISTFPA